MFIAVTHSPRIGHDPYNAKSRVIIIIILEKAQQHLVMANVQFSPYYPQLFKHDKIVSHVVLEFSVLPIHTFEGTFIPTHVRPPLLNTKKIFLMSIDNLFLVSATIKDMIYEIKKLKMISVVMYRH
jgi:hypothetical protein